MMEHQLVEMIGRGANGPLIEVQTDLYRIMEDLAKRLNEHNSLEPDWQKFASLMRLLSASTGLLDEEGWEFNIVRRLPIRGERE